MRHPRIDTPDINCQELKGYHDYLSQKRVSHERLSRLLVFAYKYLLPPHFTPDEIINTSEFTIVDIIVKRGETELQPRHIKVSTCEHRTAVRTYRDYLLTQKT